MNREGVTTDDLKNEESMHWFANQKKWNGKKETISGIKL